MNSSKRSENPKISVIIVNYNVKEYLAQAINSLERALRNITNEFWLVDNNSVDGSVDYIQKQFPNIKLIANKENVGFGKANNQALQQVSGDYIVLINPDTVVQEDTFIKLLDFFENTPDAGAATCKIINPDGRFSIDCRHGIPTPTIALWKVLGLSKIFPKSRIFGQYNLTYLSPDNIYAVPAISGSFMMIKKSVLEKVGYFDERFFMYCEDIDLCHRINQQEYKIYYVPTTQIVHYKGESTKKDKVDYVITFNRSLYQFFQKYYAPSSIFLFRWIVALGIFLRGIFIYFKNFLRNHFPVILDTFILNVMIIFSFIVRLELGRGFRWEDYFTQFWTINFIATILFLGISYYFEIYPNHRLSIQGIVKVNILTFILLAFLTFFLKQFGFSRMVVLMSFLLSSLFMVGWRVLIRRYYKGERSILGRDLFSKPTLVVGSGKDVKLLYIKLQTREDIDYDLRGWVSVEKNNLSKTIDNDKYLGSLDNLMEIIKIYGIKQIIFSARSLSYEKILKTMSNCTKSDLEFKMVPSNLEVVIGKSHIEKLDDYPLVEIDYAIGKKFNRTLKRIVDILISFPFVFLCSPVFFLYYIFVRKKLDWRGVATHGDQKNRIFIITEKKGHSFISLWVLYWLILIGRLSVVGAPIRFITEKGGDIQPLYKSGLTGLVQINKTKINSPDEEEKYHLYYMKNQSTLLDFEIILKALWQSIKK